MKVEQRSYFIIPCTNIQAFGACFKHSNLFKVIVPAHNNTR